MSDWLKVETTTPSKPEIAQISRECKCSKAEAFYAFFKFYAWADATTHDGYVDFLTADDCDEHAGGLKGFGKALETVGWIEFQANRAIIMNFERHCGKSAKRRTLDAERKRRERAS